MMTRIQTHRDRYTKGKVRGPDLMDHDMNEHERASAPNARGAVHQQRPRHLLLKLHDLRRYQQGTINFEFL
jgi:hypothetical protein